ncbi:MAG: DEAD/DEAH box helicase, partial [Thermodesulfovibrionales bacterium]
MVARAKSAQEAVLQTKGKAGRGTAAFRDNYRKDRHCVVESGTGTGKTALAYIASRYYLDEGQRVILTAPTKELVKSLYREASGIWGAKVVGLNTGNDRNVRDRFFIVSTPEGLISAVRTNKEWTKAGLLIVDEAHNILDPSRGGELDVAITVHSLNGGRVLLMSGTFPNKKELAVLLGADLFISNYRRTVVHVTELHTPDDIEAGPAPKKLPPGVVPTLLGHVYKRDSLRLRMLKELIEKHRDESILIFVPTKVVGFCLGESLVAPFHCADVEEKEKDRLVAEFRAGTIKTLLATNTLSQGVNTPADVVVVCGTRRGSYYLDGPEVAQMIGRAGRGRDEAQAYILGDKIEIFNAKKSLLARSLPLPVESMMLTSLSLHCATKEELAEALNKTYAASMTTYEKVMDSVERYLRFLKACNILHEKESG